MNYNIVIFAAISGALGGVLGAYLSNRAKGEGARAAAMIAPVVLFALLGAAGGSFVTPNENGKTMGLLGMLEKMGQQQPFEVATQKYVRQIIDNPKYMEAIKGKSQAEVSVYSQELTRLGMKRLPFAELKLWNALRSELAIKDENLCATFWTGKGLTQPILINAINKLSQQGADDWFKISMMAGTAELDQATYLEPDSNAALGAGFKFILDGLQDAERTRYEQIMSSGTEANNVDACWAARILLSQTMAMDDQLQEAFLRSLAAL